MTTLIIGNSTKQQILLGKMVEDHPKLTLVAKVSNALEAKKHFKDSRVELLFLDVELPNVNGFDLLESLTHKPMTILMTNTIDYVVKAFEYDIMYCLMKPITAISFQKSVKRAIATYALTHSIEQGEKYVLVKSKNMRKKVFFQTIQWIEGLGDYIKIVTNSGNILTLTTMQCFANKLPTDRFLRIHKSYIVNLNKINKFNSRMVEIENTLLPLSRNKRNELDKALAL